MTHDQPSEQHPTAGGRRIRIGFSRKREVWDALAEMAFTLEQLRLQAEETRATQQLALIDAAIEQSAEVIEHVRQLDQQMRAQGAVLT